MVFLNQRSIVLRFTHHIEPYGLLNASYYTALNGAYGARTVGSLACRLSQCLSFAHVRHSSGQRLFEIMLSLERNKRLPATYESLD